MSAKDSIFTIVGQRQDEQEWEEHRILTRADEKRNDGNEKSDIGSDWTVTHNNGFVYIWQICSEQFIPILAATSVLVIRLCD